MSIQPLSDNHRVNKQKPIDVKKNLIQSIHNTIETSGSYSSLTKVSLATDREIFTTNDQGTLTRKDNKVSYKFNNKDAHPLLLEEIGEFSKDFAGALHTLLYTKFISFMYYLHNELNKRGSKAKVRMAMEPIYLAENRGFEESSVEVNIKINPENSSDKLLAFKEIDKYIDIIMPLFHFLDTISKKNGQLLIIKEKKKGVFHYEWTFNINLWQFHKAFITGNIPKSGDKKYDDKYGNIINQWDRKIRSVHRKPSINNRDQFKFSIDPNNLNLMELEDEFTVNKDNLPFEWDQVNLETLLAYDKPKKKGGE